MDHSRLDLTPWTKPRHRLALIEQLQQHHREAIKTPSDLVTALSIYYPHLVETDAQRRAAHDVAAAVIRDQQRFLDYRRPYRAQKGPSHA